MEVTPEIPQQLYSHQHVHLWVLHVKTRLKQLLAGTREIFGEMPTSEFTPENVREYLQIYTGDNEFARDAILEQPMAYSKRNELEEASRLTSFHANLWHFMTHHSMCLSTVLSVMVDIEVWGEDEAAMNMARLLLWVTHGFTQEDKEYNSRVRTSVIPAVYQLALSRFLFPKVRGALPFFTSCTACAVFAPELTMYNLKDLAQMSFVL